MKEQVEINFEQNLTKNFFSLKTCWVDKKNFVLFLQTKEFLRSFQNFIAFLATLSETASFSAAEIAPKKYQAVQALPAAKNSHHPVGRMSFEGPSLVQLYNLFGFESRRSIRWQENPSSAICCSEEKEHCLGTKK